MPEEKDSCTLAMSAAMDIIREECAGKEGSYVSIGDETIVFLPERAEKEMGHSPGNPPEDEAKLEELITRCVKGDWATSWARKVVGPGAPEDALEATAERVCRGLYT